MIIRCSARFSRVSPCSPLCEDFLCVYTSVTLFALPLYTFDRERDRAVSDLLLDRRPGKRRECTELNLAQRERPRSLPRGRNTNAVSRSSRSRRRFVARRCLRPRRRVKIQQRRSRTGRGRRLRNRTRRRNRSDRLRSSRGGDPVRASSWSTSRTSTTHERTTRKREDSRRSSFRPLLRPRRSNRLANLDARDTRSRSRPCLPS